MRPLGAGFKWALVEELVPQHPEEITRECHESNLSNFDLSCHPTSTNLPSFCIFPTTNDRVSSRWRSSGGNCQKQKTIKKGTVLRSWRVFSNHFHVVQLKELLFLWSKKIYSQPLKKSSGSIRLADTQKIYSLLISTKSLWTIIAVLFSAMVKISIYRVKFGKINIW